MGATMERRRRLQSSAVRGKFTPQLPSLLVKGLSCFSRAPGEPILVALTRGGVDQFGGAKVKSLSLCPGSSSSSSGTTADATYDRGKVMSQGRMRFGLLLVVQLLALALSASIAEGKVIEDGEDAPAAPKPARLRPEAARIFAPRRPLIDVVPLDFVCSFCRAVITRLKWKQIVDPLFEQHMRDMCLASAREMGDAGNLCSLISPISLQRLRDDPIEQICREEGMCPYETESPPQFIGRLLQQRPYLKNLNADLDPTTGLSKFAEIDPEPKQAIMAGQPKPKGITILGVGEEIAVTESDSHPDNAEPWGRLSAAFSTPARHFPKFSGPRPDGEFPGEKEFHATALDVEATSRLILQQERAAIRQLALIFAETKAKTKSLNEIDAKTGKETKKKAPVDPDERRGARPAGRLRENFKTRAVRLLRRKPMTGEKERNSRRWLFATKHNKPNTVNYHFEVHDI